VLEMRERHPVPKDLDALDGFERLLPPQVSGVRDPNPAASRRAHGSGLLLAGC